MKFTLYSKEGCSYCKKAERLLELAKVEYRVYKLDADIERIHELWDEEETTHRMNVIAQNGNDGLHYSQEPSEVKGLDNFEIRNNMFEED